MGASDMNRNSTFKIQYSRFIRIKVERDAIKAKSFTTKVTKSTKKIKKQEILLFSFTFVSFVFFVVKGLSF